MFPPPAQKGNKVLRSGGRAAALPFPQSGREGCDHRRQADCRRGRRPQPGELSLGNARRYPVALPTKQGLRILTQAPLYVRKARRRSSCTPAPESSPKAPKQSPPPLLPSLLFESHLESDDAALHGGPREITEDIGREPRLLAVLMRIGPVVAEILHAGSDLLLDELGIVAALRREVALDLIFTLRHVDLHAFEITAAGAARDEQGFGCDDEDEPHRERDLALGFGLEEMQIEKRKQTYRQKAPADKKRDWR